MTDAKYKSQDWLWNFTHLYGQNSTSYLALEDDNDLFFSEKVEGYCAYRKIHSTILVAGDPIVRPEDMEAFLQDFLSFAKGEKAKIAMENITPAFLDLYENLKMKKIHIGEDAVFKLKDYSLAGKGPAKVRAAINHGVKAGLIFEEYKPLEEKDDKIEGQM